jgi:hypothetical protein
LSFIIGFPFENSSDANKTLRLAISAAAMGAEVNINRLVPRPGTEIMDKYGDKIIFSGKHYLLNRSPFKEAKKIIKSDPYAFSAFYDYPVSYASPGFIHKLESLLLLALKYFPISTFILTNKVQPLLFYKRFLSAYKSLNKMSPHLFIKKYHDYMSGYFTSKMFFNYKSILEYEYFIGKKSFSNMGQLDNIKHLSAILNNVGSVSRFFALVPIINKDCFPLACRFNLPRVLKEIKYNPDSIWKIKFDLRENDYLILPLTSNNPLTIKLNRKLSAIYKLVNGKRTINQIIHDLPLNFTNNDDREYSVSKIILDLFKGGILRLR